MVDSCYFVITDTVYVILTVHYYAIYSFKSKISGFG